MYTERIKMRTSWSMLKQFENLDDLERKARIRGEENKWLLEARKMFEDILFNIPSEGNERMKLGKEVHDLIAETKCIKLPFFNDDTTVYENQKTGVNKFSVAYKDNEISFITDVLDIAQGFVVDWKMSSKPANQQDVRQLYFYSWLLKQMGHNIPDVYMVQVGYRGDELKALSMAHYQVNEYNLMNIQNWYELYMLKMREYIKLNYKIEC